MGLARRDPESDAFTYELIWGLSLMMIDELLESWVVKE